MTTPVLTVRGLRKTYRGRRGVTANDGIDLDVAAGRVVGLLGHNGAGKTTLVNQVLGLARPDDGSVVLGDGPGAVDAVAHPALARASAAAQPQAAVPIAGLTPRTAIQIVGRLRGGRTADVAAATDRVIDALDLGEWADTKAEKLSGGVARLTAFAMTVVTPAPLVILDEPTNDVDPVRRRLLWAEIRRLADSGAGVLLVTHNVREAERVVDDLVVLDHGRVVAAGTPSALTSHLRGTLTLEADLAREDLTPHPALAGVVRTPGRLAATLAADDATAVVDWAHAATVAGTLERYALTPASLEDVYVALVGDATATTEEAAA
ncbi:ABC transporter ATP-binding protein [Sanguibacter sp. HDW7]|uniref:ABC transporter ATP-binding protein n=1 Tax=Sanguibacter sp. HDW7 TaxID=2714931 RepID=UPI0014091444|nr:ABC transporter ATP-binding protein [Sanguibacter sp. HDW7]QIK82496.1 ABC transporter ATP-binding protein [Sanguibacter sp. HDW7]